MIPHVLFHRYHIDPAIDLAPNFYPVLCSFCRLMTCSPSLGHAVLESSGEQVKLDIFNCIPTKSMTTIDGLGKLTS